jgi:hypothetical protein
VVEAGGQLADGLRRALDSPAEWIWLLDGSVAPRAPALAALLEALDRVDGIREPVVLAGVVLDPDGRVDESRAAAYRPSEIDIALTAVGRRLLPIRAVAGPALLHRSAVAAERRVPGGPPSPAATLELTARLLARGTGYLVPESEGDALAAIRDPLAEPRTVARLVGASGFRPVDRVRFGYEFALRAATRVSALRRGDRPRVH